MRQLKMKREVYQYITAAIIVVLVSLFLRFLTDSGNYHIVSYVLLFVVSVLSTFMGIGPVILAASLSAVLWNYFFIPPSHTFEIGKTEDMFIFGLFFIIAFVNGVLTSKVRKQERFARLKEKRTRALYELTRKLSQAKGFEEILQVATEDIELNFKLVPEFILKDSIEKANGGQNSPEMEAAIWAFKNSKPSGFSSGNFTEICKAVFPMKGTEMNTGVVLVQQEYVSNLDEASFWETFIAQISNALEREYLAALAEKAKLLDESDRLYKTLFNSISHEFRIPVATIMGASDAMINSPDDKSLQTALLAEIFTASMRMNRLVENLLNMSRLESGHISVRLNWCDINDLLNKVTGDLKEELEPYNLEVSIAENVPLLRLDFGLMQQALYNLLYNSSLYSKAGTTIRIEVKYYNEHFQIKIYDEGPGFPEEVLGEVFDKFYRGENTRAGGLGLGLSIVKGFVEAHDGVVRVENMCPSGSLFTIDIPSEKPKMESL